jgi:uncharacterized protein (TIGR00369 family)
MALFMPKPDFTGTWTFNPAKSVLQIPAPDATVFAVDHREPALRISRTHIVGEKQDTFSLDLTTDGREVAVDRADVRLRARAYWDGDTLVFDTTLVRAGEEATNVVRYTLSSDRRAFVAEERFRSASLNYDNIWTLDRAEAGSPHAMEGLLIRGRQVLASQPFSVRLGTELLSFSEGLAALKIPITPELLQQHGFVHGGVISYAADNALTFAGGSALDSAVVTSEFKINYLRPAIGDFLVARATVVHAGASQAVCRCDVYASADGTERLCATALGTIVKLVESKDCREADAQSGTAAKRTDPASI